MRSQLIIPNLHVVLIHYPIALLFIGVAIELFSFLGWRFSSFRAAGRWMILLGAISAVPAALSGAEALNELARQGIDSPVSWNQVLADSPLVHDAAAWQTIVRHTWLQAGATAALLILITTWLACSDAWRARLHGLFMLILLGTCGAVALGAWHAGEAIYRHGVAIEASVLSKPSLDTSSATTSPTTAASVTAPASGPSIALPAFPTGNSPRDWEAKLEYVAPPMQVHMVGAGLTIGLAAVALGLAMRTAIGALPKVGGVHDIAAALGTADDIDDPFLSAEDRRLAAERATRARYPHARFWMITMLLATLTAAGGIWLLASPANADNWSPAVLTQNVFNPEQTPGHWTLNRRAAHVIVGGTIMVATLLLAIAGRFAPRRPMLLGALAAILLGAVTAQVWVGLLLMLDANPSSTQMRFEK